MFKSCKQCGEVKSQDQFRKYYGGRKGTYNTCKFCEKINSREKYLVGKESLNEAEIVELDKIYQLWEAQMAIGLRPPRYSRGKSTPIAESLDDLIGKYTAEAKVVSVVTTAEAPADLLQWLTAELTEEPEHYQEDIYDALTAKYRPMLRVDQVTMLPVHDDTHREVLQKILERFDAYEDQYYD